MDAEYFCRRFGQAFYFLNLLSGYLFCSFWNRLKFGRVVGFVEFRLGEEEGFGLRWVVVFVVGFGVGLGFGVGFVVGFGHTGFSQKCREKSRKQLKKGKNDQNWPF